MPEKRYVVHCADGTEGAITFYARHNAEAAVVRLDGSLRDVCAPHTVVEIEEDPSDG